MPYWMAGTTESDEHGQPKSPGAINGGIAKKDGPLNSVVVVIRVDDIEKTLKNIEAKGRQPSISELLPAPATPVTTVRGVETARGCIAITRISRRGAPLSGLD